MRGWWILVLAGCGRISFDPLVGDGGAMSDGRAIDVVPLDGPFPAGLVAWYPFDDSAANTADVVGGVNGSCAGSQCPVTTAGHHGSAFLFDGNDDCIQVPDLGQLDLAALTVTIWLRQDVQDNESAFAKRVDIGANVNNSWQVETTTNFEIVLTSNHGGPGNTQQVSGTGAILVGSWYSVAMTFDGTRGQLYTNGVAAFSMPNVTGALSYDAHPLWIGCDDNGAGFFLHWNGALDDLQIYNRVLSDPEIAALASQ